MDYQEITRARATLSRLGQADLERAAERVLRGPVEPDYREDSLLKWQRLTRQSAEPPAKVTPKPKENSRMTQDTPTRSEMHAHIQKAIEGAVSSVGEKAGTNERHLRQEIA